MITNLQYWCLRGSLKWKKKYMQTNKTNIHSSQPTIKTVVLQHMIHLSIFFGVQSSMNKKKDWKTKNERELPSMSEDI